MPNHTVTTRANFGADQQFVGKGTDDRVRQYWGSRGVPVDYWTKFELGTPAAVVTDAIIAAATSTELPGAAGTTTYTPATSGTSPQDSANKLSTATVRMSDGVEYLVWVLDVPRAVTSTTTHNSSVVAMTLTIRGFDQYGVPMTESLSVAATGTSQAANGKKAFKWIKSFAITVAADATANTLNAGFGKVLGLPFVVDSLSDVASKWFEDATDAGTVVKADATSPATATTGDVRGTFAPAGTPNGAKAVEIVYRVDEHSTAVGIRGVTQYAG